MAKSSISCELKFVSCTEPDTMHSVENTRVEPPIDAPHNEKLSMK